MQIPQEGNALAASTRFTSPEKWWRAAAALVAAGVAGWVVSVSIRLRMRPGVAPGLPPVARLGVIGAALVIGLWLAIAILRAHLTVTADGLTDHRLIRVVRIPWGVIARFDVRRPSGPWGGYCVSAVCRDGRHIDLLSTRAYSRVPSASHLDELQRICWTLDAIASRR